MISAPPQTFNIPPRHMSDFINKQSEANEAEMLIPRSAVNQVSNLG